jgi:hypothetical protein
MNELSKGKPPGSTYLELWCRTYDDSFVINANPREIAFHAGFTGQRAEAAWKGRMEILRDMGFVANKPGSTGPFHYVLIYNPYRVAQKLHDSKTDGLRETLFNALRERALAVGASEFRVTETN